MVARLESVLTPGSVFRSRYQIKEILPKGADPTDYSISGGYKYVRRARDLARQRTVALKVFKPFEALGEIQRQQLRGSESALEDLFGREHRYLFAIENKKDDPRTSSTDRQQLSAFCAIYDAESVPMDGTKVHYIVEEFVNGESLEQIIRKKQRLSHMQAVLYIVPVLEALDSLHTCAGLLHQDIRPSNILIAETDNGAEMVKITDFGTADKVRRAYKLSGSVYSLAPEQLEEPSRTGPKAEVYHAGVVLYRMLTGNYPHGNPQDDLSRDQVKKRIMEREFLVPLEGDARIPLELRKILAEMLANTPQARPNVADAALMLHTYQSDLRR